MANGSVFKIYESKLVLEYCCTDEERREEEIEEELDPVDRVEGNEGIW